MNGGRLIRDPRVGYQDHVEWRTIENDPSKAGIEIGHHFDGSQDATVRIRSLKLSVTADAPPRPEVVAAVAELEAAQREWLIAKHSRNPLVVRRSRRRLIAANERLVSVQ